MSIFAEIGGADAVHEAVDRFYVRVLADDVLAPYFQRTDMRRQKRHMRAFLAVALGGADVYAGRDLGVAHAGMGITHQAFDHVVEHLVDTLVSLDVPMPLIEAIGAKLAPLREVIVSEPARVGA